MANTAVTKKRSKTSILLLGVLALVVVLVVGGTFYFVTRKPTRTITAHFSAAVGVYVGSDVRVLGIKVGTITKITPRVDSVDIEMKYDASVKIPADAAAYVIPPSIVSDRYLQLAPVYTGGAVMANHADIPLSRTYAPVELDDIYKSLSDLSVALGPKAGQTSGPLNDLINTTNKNLDGNGELLGQTFTDLSQAAKTFADGRTDLFGTVNNLQAFTAALSANDTQVKHLNDQLAAVTQNLADQRSALALALKNLSAALSDISTFINSNQSSIQSSVASLKTLSTTLVQNKDALSELLAVAPTAVSNITHAYNPVTHVFDVQGSTADADSCSGNNGTYLIGGVPAHVGKTCTSTTAYMSGVPGVTGTPTIVDVSTGDVVLIGSGS